MTDVASEVRQDLALPNGLSIGVSRAAQSAAEVHDLLLELVLVPLPCSGVFLTTEHTDAIPGVSEEAAEEHLFRGRKLPRCEFLTQVDSVAEAVLAFEIEGEVDEVAQICERALHCAIC